MSALLAQSPHRLPAAKFPAASIHLWGLFEIEIGQVHIPVRQDVHGEKISPLVEMHLEKLLSQIPVVPLTPSQRIEGS